MDNKGIDSMSTNHRLKKFSEFFIEEPEDFGEPFYRNTIAYKNIRITGMNGIKKPVPYTIGVGKNSIVMLSRVPNAWPYIGKPILENKEISFENAKRALNWLICNFEDVMDFQEIIKLGINIPL